VGSELGAPLFGVVPPLDGPESSTRGESHCR
jgi:hypothetical protein